MEAFQTIEVHNRTHVLRPISLEGRTIYQYPNYMGTGKVLCGILRQGETVAEWHERVTKDHSRRMSELSAEKRRNTKNEIV